MRLRPYVAIAIATALVAGTAVGAVLATATSRELAVQGTGISSATGGIYVVGQAAVTAAASYWTPSAMTAATNAPAHGAAQAQDRAAADQGTIERQAAALGAGHPAAGRTQRSGPPAGTPDALSFSGVPTVGTLFYTVSSGRHFCTASVLDSTTGDLILTAAHCVYAGRYSANLVFVPGYADGNEPWGAWPVSAILVAKGWRNAQDPNWDMAFLQVVPPANTVGPIEKVTGGLRLGFGLGYRQRFTAIGYNDTDSEPVQCAASSFRFAASQMEFYCKDFWYGTSGGPWITGYDPATGRGTIFGVIGGYQAGGYYSWASYSAVFGRAALGLYRLAEQHAAANPAAGPAARP